MHICAKFLISKSIIGRYEEELQIETVMNMKRTLTILVAIMLFASNYHGCLRMQKALDTAPFHNILIINLLAK